MKIITLPLSVSNAFLVEGKKGFVLFDSGLQKDEAKLLQLLKGEKVSPKDIILIFHTHGHPDHIGCTPALQRMGAGPSTIFKDDKALMEGGQPDLRLRGYSLFGKLMRKLILNPFPPVKADIIFEGEQSLEEYGLDAKFVHTPGHSDGSVSTLFRDGDVIAGDLLSGKMLRKQKPSIPMFVIDENEIRASVKKILPEGTGTWYVGHGGPLKGSAVAAFIGG